MLTTPAREDQHLLTADRNMANDRLSAQRQLVRASLGTIASKLRAELDNAGLDVKAFFTVPSSGEALLTFATPVDPSDLRWPRANQIICHIVDDVLGLEGVTSRLLPCASSGTSMTSAEVSIAGGENVGGAGLGIRL